MRQIKTIERPAFFQRLQWVADPVGYMESAVGQYPDIFRSQLAGFGNILVFVNHPQGIQQLLSKDTTVFSAPGRVNGILQPLVGDSSVFMLEGDRHQRDRKLLMPPFHGERMRSYGQTIVETTRQAIAKIPGGKPFTARATMQEISLEVILKAVFGVYEGERYQQLKHLLASILGRFESPWSNSLLFFPSLQKDLGPWSPWGSFLRQRADIDRLIYAEIADRRTQDRSDRADVLSLLLSARDEEGRSMTEVELRDELITLLFAGHETTATAIAWSLYWVHRHPEVRDRLRSELQSLGDAPDPAEIVRLPYLTAVCNETLRIVPVAILTFPREAMEPIEIMGYPIASGTLLWGCIYLLHHREELYPQPQQFKPERFLQHPFSPYEFMPFGGGARRCIGSALAQYEMKLVLATLLSNDSFHLADTRPIKPQRRGVTLAPKGGVRLVRQ